MLAPMWSSCNQRQKHMIQITGTVSPLRDGHSINLEIPPKASIKLLQRDAAVLLRRRAVLCCLMSTMLLSLVLLGVSLPCAHTFVSVSRQGRPLSPSLADGVRRDHIFGLSACTRSSKAAVTRGPARRARHRYGRVLMGTEEVSGYFLHDIVQLELSWCRLQRLTVSSSCVRVSSST